MANKQINNRQMQAYSITPTQGDGSPGSAVDIVWESDSDGVEMSTDPALLASKELPIDGFTALAVPDDDFVTVSDVTVRVRGLGATVLEESDTLSVTDVVEGNTATALNLRAGGVFDK